LNDCKYGYNVDKNVLDLNLLRSPGYPDETADQGEQEFTYSLYPHGGNHMEAKVNQVAYELNIPLVLHGSCDNKSTDNKTMSFIELDRDNIVIETVKKAEESGEVIVRLYESHGASSSATVRFGVSPKSVKLVNLMEQDIESIKRKDDTVVLPFKPFEILTLKIGF
jgi:alpha-mannosidase